MSWECGTLRRCLERAEGDRSFRTRFHVSHLNFSQNSIAIGMTSDSSKVLERADSSLLKMVRGS